MQVEEREIPGLILVRGDEEIAKLKERMGSKHSQKKRKNMKKMMKSKEEFEREYRGPTSISKRKKQKTKGPPILSRLLLNVWVENL